VTAVSMAIRKNMPVLDSWLYLAFLLAMEWLAAAPASGWIGQLRHCISIWDCYTPFQRLAM